MKGSLIIVTLLIFLVVIGLGIFLFVYRTGNVQDESDPTGNGETIPSVLYSEQCSPLEGQNRWNCFTEIAIIHHDVSLCEFIPPVEQGGFPYNNCLSNVARTSNDVAICDLIDLEVTKGACLYALLNESFDSEYCHILAPNDNQVRLLANCLKNVAVEHDDPTVCAEIGAQHISYVITVDDIPIRDLCNHNIALNTQNSALCELVSHEQLKELCIDKST